MENTLRVLCSECGRNLKAGIKCEQCERWYQYSCGIVKVQTAKRENWCCDKCRSEKVRELQEKLQNALRQINELNVRNTELETKLQMAGSGEKKSTAKIQNVKCMVVGDTIVRNMGSEHADMKECFPVIKAEKLHSDVKEGARLCRDANYTRGYKRSGINEKSRFYNGRSIHIGGRCKEVTEIQTGTVWGGEAQRRVMAAYWGPK